MLIVYHSVRNIFQYGNNTIYQMVLEKVKKYTLSKFVDDDTTAILLVGSWARGKSTDLFDIDLFVIKKFQLIESYCRTEHEEDFQLDIWFYDHESMYENLTLKHEDLNSVNKVSLTVLGLKDAVIWYDKDKTIQSKIDLANNWKWENNGDTLFNTDIEPSSLEGWIKNAVEEDLMYLKAAKSRYNQGMPITHRKKDYPEIASPNDEEKAKKLYKLANEAYQSFGIETRWTEFRDAERALETSNYGAALDSLKDVLRYMVRYDLPSAPTQLMDPQLWISVSNLSISNNLREVLEFAYS